LAAALFALLMGGLGIHKFYLGQVKSHNHPT
jgi:TM2 domain-containing membrane protein YozV